MDCVNHVSVEDMRRAIVSKYGPTIHNTFVSDMPMGQIARIYIQMMGLGPSDPLRKRERLIAKESKKVVPIKRKKKNYILEGQMSLFD